MLINYKHWPVDHPNFQRGLYNTWDIVNRCDGSNFMGTLRQPQPVNYAVDNCGCNTHPCSCGSVRIVTAIPSRPKDSLEYLDATKLSASKAAELVASLKKLGECKSGNSNSDEPTNCPTIEKLLAMGDLVYAIMADSTVMEIPRSKLQICDEKGLPTQVVSDVKKSEDSLLLTLTNIKTGEETTVTFTPAVATTNAAGIVRLATQEEVTEGTSTDTAITPETLAKVMDEAVNKVLTEVDSLKEGHKETLEKFDDLSNKRGTLENIGFVQLVSELSESDESNAATPKGVLEAIAASVSKTTKVIAGNGLTGGGELSANLTIALGTPGTLSGESTNSVTATSHTHAILAATTAASGVTRLSTATNSTATDMAATPSAVKAAYDLAATAAPSGMVVFFAQSTPPLGWLKCNGAAVSRTVYASLFSAIGTTFGAGDGSTTFNLPDLRGEFVRGWDAGRGVDAGRAAGSAQSDAFQGHARNLKRSQSTAVMHGVNFFQNVEVNDNLHSPAPAAIGVGDSWLTADYLPHGSYGAPRVAAETRPRNIALLACIKI